MKKKIILSSLFIFILVLPFVLIFCTGKKTTKDVKPEPYEARWYYYNEEGKEIQVEFPLDLNSEINTTTTIYTKLPDNSSNTQTLFFRSIYQSVEIKIEDTLLYEYNEGTDKKFGFSMPRKLNIVNLPNDIGGKVISVSITSPYYKYSGYFGDVEIGESTEIINNVYSKYALGLTLSIVLIFLNLSFMLANYLFYKVKISSPSVFYIFLSGLFVGLWLLGDSKLITLFVNNHITNHLIYVSLMCFIIIFSAFLKKTIKGKYSLFSNVLFYISIGNIVLQYILHFTKILDFVYLMPLNLLLILLLFVFYLLYLNQNIKELKNKKKKIEFIYIIEVILVLVLCILTIANIILQNLGNINMHSTIGVCYFIFIMALYVKNVIYIVRTAESSKVYKARLRETQNYLMQSQMKPHFIFNTLGAIRTLIMSSPKAAYDMTTNFSKYLRANISTIEPGEKIPFSQELDHIKAYVAIERERFKNRIIVIYDIECDNFYLPPLSVEPLVENAIKHGVCKKVKGGVVKISSKEYDDRYEVIVEDDGVGFDTSILESNDNTKSVGLKYIILRLKQLSNADFEITSEKGKGTKAIITIKK